MTLSAIEWLALFVAVGFGALVQSVVGFGLALLVAPIVSVLRPDLMPTTMILMSLPLSSAMAFRGRADIDWVGLGWTVLGRVPTAIAGAVIVVLVSARTLSGLVGAMVIVSCAISAFARPAAIRPSRALGAGALSGFMETTAAVGGAPIALLYQRRPAPEVRSTLAMSFIVGKSVAFVALAVGGAIGADQVLAAVSLYPALWVGAWMGSPLITALGQRSIRPAVLVLCCATGAVAVANALMSS